MVRTTFELIRPDWPLPAGVQVAFSTRRLLSGPVSAAPWDGANLGLHVGDNAQQVRQHRIRLQQQLPAVRAIQWLDQVHGTECRHACGNEIVLPADACWTAEPGLACAVMTADCLPVLLVSANGQQIAAIHAGWRGLAAGVLEQALTRFSGSVMAMLGPAIGPAAFEVGPEVRASFAGAPASCFYRGHGDRYHANLHKLARWRLELAGVERIFGEEWCTYREATQFYSFRRDGQTGRQASLIWRE